MANQALMQRERTNCWEDWVNAVLAIWFFLSPWILQFGSRASTPMTSGAAGNASWNAWIFGVIVFVVSLSAISRMNFWQEWVNLVLGIWVFIAPWVLHFATGGYSAAAWDHWVIGVLFFVFSGITILQYQSGHHATG